MPTTNRNSNLEALIMLPRERVISTINHIQPDKVPIDFGGMQTSIHIKAYLKLLDFLHIEDPNVQYADIIQHIALPCDAVLQRFEVDTRYLRFPGSVKPSTYVPEQNGLYTGIYDQFGVFWGDKEEKPAEDVLYYDPVIHPLANLQSPQAIENYAWPDGHDKTPFKGIRDQAIKLHKTDYAIVTQPAGCIFEYTTFMFGFAKALRYIRTRPELITAAVKCLTRYWLDYAETFLREAGEFIDVYCINGDLAEQAGPLFNMKLYEQLAFPYERQLADRVHSLTNAKINYHCCGSTPQFIPYFAKIGYNIYNPVQISAYDMEPCSLKARFGDIITFWGGACNTQKTLPFGTPSTIREEVRQNLACFKPGGGYVASNIHNITAEVSPQNIAAMFDAIRTFRNY